MSDEGKILRHDEPDESFEPAFAAIVDHSP